MANMEENKPEPPVSPGRARRLRLGAVAVLAMAAAGFLYWFLFLHNLATTDDAYARADTAQISSRVSGAIARVLVENDFPVSTGQPLVELDPADYKAALDRATAALEQEEADLRAAEITLPPVDIQTSSQVQAGEAVLKAAQDTEQQTRHTLDQLRSNRAAAAADLYQAERDYRRFESLFKSGAGTDRQREQARTTFDRTKAQLSAVDAQIAALESALSATTQQVSRARAQLQSTRSERANVDVQRYRVESQKGRRDKAKADLETARLQLSYCTVAAPISGFIAQKNIQVGDRVQPGQAMMAVVPLRDIYIEANFKETQLTHIRIGQPATIFADIYPGYEYKGKVAGIRAGTGAAFSLIPAENATGNWIKVVQRIPVKIELDQTPPPDHPLRLGASLVVTVNVSDRSGPLLMAARPAPASSASPPKP
ncbi:MAG: HlyD family secretion protein [Syntrophobacter sp.]